MYDMKKLASKTKKIMICLDLDSKMTENRLKWTVYE